MVKLFEELSMNAWPAFQTLLFDGWILRLAEGYTKRANSISPLYGSSQNDNDKLAFCEAFYGKQGLPAIFKLTDEGCPDKLDNLLEKRGYLRLDETALMVLKLSKEDEFPVKGSVSLNWGLSEDWLENYFQCSKDLSLTNRVTARRLLGNIKGALVTAKATQEKKPCGFGLGVMERGYLGIFDILVSEDFRRKGVGRAVMEGLLSSGREAGAHTAYLQVVKGNTPAERLYEGLGFKKAYSYWYRKQPV